MDDELKLHLEAMEKRLVGRINDGSEPVLNRLTALGGEVRNLGTKTDTAREFSFRVPKLVVEALEAGLFPRLRRIEDVLSAIGTHLVAIEGQLKYQDELLEKMVRRQ